MFSQGSYAYIWEIKQRADKYTDARISTSKKDKESGEYHQDFGAFVRFVGNAHEKMARLSERDHFQIGKCGVENKYDKEKKATYTNYLVFDIETDDHVPDVAAVDDEIPFA